MFDMLEPFTPPTVDHDELISNWHWINCSDATFRFMKRLRSLDLVLPCSETSLLPNNRRAPTIRLKRENLDGTTTITYNTNRHRYGFCPYVVSDHRGEVFYDLDTFDKWVSDCVVPMCRPKPKRPCRPASAKAATTSPRTAA